LTTANSGNGILDLYLYSIFLLFQELVVKMLTDKAIISSKRFIEIGCGSGAICVSLLKHLPLVSTAVYCNITIWHSCGQYNTVFL